MSVLTCPQGHESIDGDFCSVCGTKIPAATLSLSDCPDCKAPREPQNAAFCEVCGFNFESGAHGDLRPASSSETAPESTDPATAPLPKFELVVTIDPDLRSAVSPAPPADFAPFFVSLEPESVLIGRTSERRGIFPEIALDQDDAVSHRHAILIRNPQGELLVRDIGSSNGTRLNGAELQPFVDHAASRGDTITLGHWSCITIKAAP